MDAASVSLRPALISVGLELVAVAVLVGLGAVALWLVDDSCYNYRNAKTGDATPSTTILVLIRVLTQMLGGVLSVYACGVAVWIAPLLSECTAILLLQQRRRSRRGRPHRSSSDEDAASPPLSPPPLRPFSVHACRAAAVSTAALGLGLVGIGLLGGRRVFDDDTARLPRNDDDHDDTAAMMHTLCVVLGAGGLALWTLSSASLMASFWPSTTTTTLVGAAAHPATTTAQQYDNDDDMTSPLLLESPAANSNTATTTTTRSTRSSSYQPPPESSDGVSMSSPVDLALLDSDKNCENENFDDLEARSSGSSWTTALMDNRGRRLSHDDDDDNDDATEQPQPSRRGSSSTRRLLQLAAPQVLYLYAGCLVLLVRLPFSLAMPHFVSTTLAAVAAADFATARREIELLLLSGSMDAMLDFWAFFLFGYANQRIVRGLRVDLFRRLLGQEMAFFDAHSSGELASRLNSDCSEMAGDLTWFFRFSIESIVRIVGITSYMMWRSPILGSCALSIIPAVAVVNKFYGDWLRHNAVHVQDALAEANVVAQEALSNVRTVIAFVAESLEIARYESRIERQFQLNIKQLYMTAMYYMGKKSITCVSDTSQQS